MTGKDMRIIIAAKDTEAIATLVQHLVTNLNADTTLVDTLEDTRVLADADRFDVVITARHLADGSGLDLLQCREMANLPIILLDDQMDAERILNAMRLGAADVIPAPIDFEHLLMVLRRVVQKQRTDRHEAYRSERLRRLSSRLIQDRRELRKRVDLICNDLVVAYRRLAEKVVAAMNQDELERLFDDHYVGEAQTLTTGAEENLLKLAELRSRMSDEQRQRWDEIKRTFARIQSIGSAADDPVTRVTGQLGIVSDRLDQIGRTLAAAASDGAGKPAGDDASLAPYLAKLDDTLSALREGQAKAAKKALRPSADRDFMTQQAALIDATLIPLLRSMAHKLREAPNLKDRRLKALLPKLEYIDTLADLMGALDKIDNATMSSIKVDDPKSPD